MLANRPPSTGYRFPSTVYRQLIAYFRSGWAFLIPYLAAYLLYAWLKWPVNPEGAVKAIGEISGGASAQLSTLGSPQSPFLRPPCLLHIYWLLHAIHLLLGAIALRSWWRQLKPSALNSERSTAISPSLLARLWPIAPWLCLALIFYIPGVYLEWPSDPWEHLRRITEWATQFSVGTHSAGYKSFYFFAYSFVGSLPSSSLLQWVNIYYVCICLLLAWQYYRLAKAVGLDKRWAFLFIIFNTLTLGNSCFSFYRYYGLASTMVAQLGALALIRIALLIATDQQRKTKRTLATSSSQYLTLPAVRQIALSLVPCAFLVVLIACNHIQGLGVAGLAIASISIWRLLKARRSNGLWLTVGAIALSFAAIEWWPRQSEIESALQSQGWFNICYGFNLFTWSSPAADRGIQILGIFGVINLLAGAALLWQKNVVGWLTVGPVIGLGIPVISIPLANSLIASDFAGIVTFHRMLFAIPAGLALTTIAQEFCSLEIRPNWLRIAKPFRKSASFRFAVLIVCLSAFLEIPSGRPHFNRAWHALASTSHDLEMKPVWLGLTKYALLPVGDTTHDLVTLPAPGFLVEIQHEHHAVISYRHNGDRGYPELFSRVPPPFDVMLFASSNCVSSYSQAALLSGHWPIQEVVLAASGATKEFEAQGMLSKRPSRSLNTGIFFTFER